MKTVNMISVQSSNIKSIGFTDNSLYVEYTSGTYKYDNVDEQTFQALLQAESKGKFMNANIKPKYNYSKIN